MNYCRIAFPILLGCLPRSHGRVGADQDQDGHRAFDCHGCDVRPKERGYFKEAGLDVDIDIIDASAGIHRQCSPKTSCKLSRAH